MQAGSKGDPTANGAQEDFAIGPGTGTSAYATVACERPTDGCEGVASLCAIGGPASIRASEKIPGRTAKLLPSILR
jgi:hypothetical protein